MTRIESTTIGIAPGYRGAVALSQTGVADYESGPGHHMGGSDHPIGKGNCALIVALVGGQSRSGKAFRAFVRGEAPDIQCRAIVRGGNPPSDDDLVTVSDYSAIEPDTFAGCDAVINFVGTVRAATYEEIHRVNVTVPARVAKAAAAAGVSHFIQLSSLSLHGHQPWIDASSPLAPTTEYGRTKLEAEQVLQAIDSIVVTLLRVPTIYGPDGPSKMGQLAKILRLLPVFPAPAPLPARSIISHANLSRVLIDILRKRRKGVVYAADPEPFTLALMSRILPNRPKILTLPSPLFRPLSWISPGAYTSLYESGEIANELLIRPRDGLVPTDCALAEAFG